MILMVLATVLVCTCSPAKRPVDEPDGAATDTDTDTDSDTDTDDDTDTDTDADTDTDTDTDIDIADVIAAGAHHTCAVLTSGVMKCWGYNDYGSLGDGSTEHSSVPMQVGHKNDWVTVAAGYAFGKSVVQGETIDGGSVSFSFDKLGPTRPLSLFR